MKLRCIKMEDILDPRKLLGDYFHFHYMRNIHVCSDYSFIYLAMNMFVLWKVDLFQK